MSQPAITVENLSKAYRIGLKEEIPDTLLGAFTAWVQAPWQNLRRLSRLDTSQARADGPHEHDIIWALKDVSFEVQEGEVLGIIGRNGAGKSTLLKILSRITEPTAGRAIIRGRVSSLLEVGTGFHPELTGRENIYMNGTILGMTKREIDRKFDEIVDFSGVEKFLDTPIKRYSSGMKVRLAFAVAAHLDPEILIIDEVLAVGDADFQRKCLGKMQDVARSGRTVLFVSHNMAAVTALCESAILINQGQTQIIGPAENVIEEYLDQHSHKLNCIFDMSDTHARMKNMTPIIKRIELLNGNIHTYLFTPKDSLTCRMEIAPQTRINDARLAISIEDAYGRRITTLTNYLSNQKKIDIASKQTITCTVPALMLAPGKYYLSFSVSRKQEGLIDSINNAVILEIQPGGTLESEEHYTSIYGPVITECSWSCDD